MNSWTKMPRVLSAIAAFAAVVMLQAARTPPADAADAPVKGSGLPFSEELAALGDQIFDDRNLSVRRNQACNSCHSSAWGFTGPDAAVNAGGAVYEGSIPGRFGDRKPPSSAYSSLPPVFGWSRKAGGLFVGGNFWDGRATGSELGNPSADQAKGPFLNPAEQALRDPACVVYRVSIAGYASEYKRLWGTAIESIQFPAGIDELCSVEGPPLAIDETNRAKISKEFDNIAISIAVYEESHNLFSSRFDAMRKGLYKFTAQEQRGFALFQGKARCANCHSSAGQRPSFTDHTYANVGVPANPELPIYRTHPEFVDSGLGGFLASRPEWVGYAPGEWGKMRVPTLRNADLRPQPADTKAYMHNGVFKSLEEVVRFYNTRDALPRCGPTNPRADWGEVCWPAPEVPVNVNNTDLGSLGLTPDEEADLVVFIKTLSDGYLPNPRRTR